MQEWRFLDLPGFSMSQVRKIRDEMTEKMEVAGQRHISGCQDVVARTRRPPCRQDKYGKMLGELRENVLDTEDCTSKAKIRNHN